MCDSVLRDFDCSRNESGCAGSECLSHDNRRVAGLALSLHLQLVHYNHDLMLLSRLACVLMSLPEHVHAPPRHEHNSRQALCKLRGLPDASSHSPNAQAVWSQSGNEKCRRHLLDAVLDGYLRCCL